MRIHTDSGILVHIQTSLKHIHAFLYTSLNTELRKNEMYCAKAKISFLFDIWIIVCTKCRTYFTMMSGSTAKPV